MDYTKIFQWAIELRPQKLIIALLLGLICYFGWNTYNTSQEYKMLYDKYSILNDKRTSEAERCDSKITAARQACDSARNAYRDKVESELRQIAKDNDKQLKELYREMAVLLNKSNAKNQNEN